MKRLSIVCLLFSGACFFDACNRNNTNIERSITSDSTVISTTDSSVTGSNMDTMSNKMEASGILTDKVLKTFATSTLPTLQKHLDAIQNIKAKM